MSRAGDDAYEMTTDCFDQAAFDALLAGRPVPAGAEPLVAFAARVREVSAVPGRPSPALEELLATGLLPTSGSSASKAAQPARTPGHQDSEHPRRRRTMFGLLTAAAAKFAGAGAVAHAAAGLGIAMASVTGAAAAGVLPAGVQDHLSGVLESVTPFDLPDSTPDTSPSPPEGTVTTEQVEGSTDDEATTGPGDLPQDGGTTPVTPGQADFGQQVREDAQDAGVDGKEISENAREAHQPERPDTAAPAHPETPVPAQPDTGRPDFAPAVPAPADQGIDHVPAGAGRP